MTALRVGSPLGRVAGRHSLGVEAIGVLTLYGLYEATRGLIAGDRAAAVRHAHDIASLERSLHVFVEGRVQAAAGALPGLIGALGLLYLTLHLAVTGFYLLWLHRRRPGAFPFVRTTLLVASALALIGYLAFPTAPPRDAALGIADTISGGRVDLDHGLISSLYNPFAAVPSMHVGYAVIVGASLVLHGGRRSLRVLGFLYPALVLFVVVATGNHFLMDAVAGASVAAVAAALARTVTRDERHPDVVTAGSTAALPAPCRIASWSEQTSLSSTGS
jgi:PAP2 superfamily